jgi:gliding motility-associated-like protein
MMKHFLTYCFLLIFAGNSLAQLTANAGPNRNICPGRTVTMGGSPAATGGTPPYSYSWQPSNFLSSTTGPNPTANGVINTIQYTLTVTDKDGNTASATAIFFVDLINDFNAGIDTGYCLGQQNGITIGNPFNSTNGSNHTFAWTPSSTLDNANSPNPVASNSVVTKYTLTVSNGGVCPDRKTSVTVTPFLKPVVDASPDVVIDEGNTITLNGTGSAINFWLPAYNIRYANTATPDVWPTVSTTYTLYVEDSHRCTNFDTVHVEVIKGDKLFFYSAFTPNADGENDYFYIGNLEKYPDNNLKIYNRYGKMIYSATNYANNWDGTYLGNEIPTGTYFYIFTDGVDQKYKGTVTLIR